MQTRSFQHITAPLRLYSGPDSLTHLGRELDRLGAKRAMIVCGRSMAREGSPLELVRAAMGERCAGVYSGVLAHSPLPAVESAARELAALEADAVVAVGGGSAIVTARAASILRAEGKGAHSLATTRDASGELKSPKLLAPKLPQIVVATTPTTAAVKAGSAVFDPVQGKRLALFDPKTRVQALFVTPALLASAPRELVVSASLNTFVMATEGLMSRTGDPLADAALMHALRLAGACLSDPDRLDDPGARTDLMLAAVLCGQGTDHTGAGLTSVLGHAIGARWGIENGIANAIVLPHALRFNAEAARTGLGNVATALGLPVSTDASPLEAIIARTGAIFGKLGVPRTLREAGVPRDALRDLAALGMLDWFLRGNPRPVREAAELEQVLDAAW